MGVLPLDPLFEQSINDLQAVKQQLMEKQQDNINSMGDGSQLPPALNSLTNKEKLESESSKLQAIREHDLEARGREELIKQNMMSLHPDYSRPGYSRYLKDAEIIANAQDSLLSNLLGKLKDLGIDCKTVKGEQRYEPEYYLQICQQQVKDTVYNQVFCEQLRNQYNCTDSLTVKCIQKTTRELKPETIHLAHHEMPNHWWIGRGRDGQMCYGGIQNTTDRFAIFNNNLTVLTEVKQHIIGKTGNKDIEVPTQAIMFFHGGDGVSLAGINSSGRVVLYQLDQLGNRGYIQGTWHPNPESVSGSVRFFYKVPQEEKCLQWQEEWIEQCVLN